VFFGFMARCFASISKSEGCTIAILVDRIITVIGFKNTGIEVISMSFSEFDVTYRTRKENFLQQIDRLTEWWDSVEKSLLFILQRSWMLRSVWSFLDYRR